jgi:hypothetical protein
MLRLSALACAEYHARRRGVESCADLIVNSAHPVETKGMFANFAVEAGFPASESAPP